MAGASDITKYLADIAGGAIKNGGGGMEKGVELLCQQAAEKAVRIANKANSQRVISATFYCLAGLAALTGVGYTVLSRKNKKIIDDLNTYHKLIYIDKISCIKEIAKNTGKSSKVVRVEIERLIKKGLLVGARFDTETDNIIIA